MNALGKLGPEREIELKSPAISDESVDRVSDIAPQRLQPRCDAVLGQLVLGLAVADKVFRFGRRDVPVGDQRHGHRDSVLRLTLQNPAVAKQTTVADIDDRHAVTAERTVELLSDCRQQQVLTVALDDNQRAGEEQVGLRRVEEPTKELIIVHFEPGMGRAQRKGAVADDHRHGLKLGAGRELRTMGGE